LGDPKMEHRRNAENDGATVNAEYGPHYRLNSPLRRFATDRNAIDHAQSGPPFAVGGDRRRTVRIGG
jgi:hypothetical protein